MYLSAYVTISSEYLITNKQLCVCSFVCAGVVKMCACLSVCVCVCVLCLCTSVYAHIYACLCGCADLTSPGCWEAAVAPGVSGCGDPPSDQSEPGTL